MERNRKVDHPTCGSRPCGGCRVHLSALLVAIRNACSSCSSLSSVASRAELHMAAVRQPTDTVGRWCGWSASTEHTRPSQLWSSSFSASSCIESSSLCTWSRSPARRLPRLPRSPRCGGGTGAPWGLISLADAPFPVLAALVFVVAVFGLALVGCGGKARCWSYCWSSPCSSRLGQR